MTRVGVRKTKKFMKRFIIVVIALCTALPSFGWGQKGHDVVAYIAECNLTPKVYQKVVKALGGHSLVYYANWLDNASYSDQYRYTKSWHYANVDEGYTYDTMTKNEKGDVVTAINELTAELKSGKLTPEQESIRLRMLIHLVGDIHCPMHAGHLSDRGGNEVIVKFFNKEIKLHSLWDTALVEAAHKWSYTEWEQQLNRYCPAERKAEIASGEAKDWLNESHAIATEIYKVSPEKGKLSYDYVAYYAPIIEKQLLSGGLRLARILNELYD